MPRTSPPSPELSRRLLAALQTAAEGEEIDAAELADLVAAGLLTRASLAEGFQLTARGLTVVASTSPREPAADEAAGPGEAGGEQVEA